MKVRELKGVELDYWAARAEQMEVDFYGVDPSIRARVPGLGVHAPWSPSRYWNQAGPIIDREIICIDAGDGSFPGEKMWAAWLSSNAPMSADEEITGPTALVAAMRCFVHSKFGDDVPDLPFSHKHPVIK